MLVILWGQFTYFETFDGEYYAKILCRCILLLLMALACREMLGTFVIFLSLKGYQYSTIVAEGLFSSTLVFDHFSISVIYFQI